MQQFGLNANFAFLTQPTTFASMDQVVAGLEKIESAVQTTADAIASAGLGAKLDRALGTSKAPQAMSTQVEKLGKATKTATAELDPLKKELRALKAEARNIDFGDLTDEKQFSGARQEIEAYIGSLQKLEREVKGSSTAEREFAASLKTTAKAAQTRIDIADEQRKAMIASDRLGKAQSVQGAGKSILNELKEPQKLAGEISKGLGNIQKLAGDIGGGGINELRGEILSLSVDFARTPEEVTAVFESLAGAGRSFEKLGDRIADAKEILTNTTALDITSEAATKLGIALGSTFKDKLQEIDPITGKTATSVAKLNDMSRRFGATVNVLTDNLPDVAISAEGVIPTLNSLLKSIGSAENFKPTSIIAFGAALNAIGTEAELSGSFVNRMTSAISGAKKSGGGVGAYSKAIGMEADEFENLLNTDKLEVLRRVVLAYKNLEGGEIEKGKFFTQLGVGADQDKKIIQGLAANIGVLNDAMKLSPEAYEKGTSGIDEFNRVTKTSVFQTERAAKALGALKLTLGFAVNEVLLPFIKAFGDIATIVLHVSNKFPVLAKVIGVAAYGLGVLAAVAGTAAVALFGFQQAAAAANVATLAMSRGLLPLTGFFDAALKAAVATNPLVGAMAELKNISIAARAPMSGLILQIQALGGASLSFALSPLGLTLIGLTAFVTILEKATPGVSLLGMAIGAIAAPFSFAFGILKGFTGALLELVGGTTGKTFQVISAPFQVVGEAINTAMKIMANFENKGEEVGKNLAKFITVPITAAGNRIKQLWDATLGGITNRLSGFAAFARLIGGMLTGALAQNSPGPTWLIAFFWDKTIGSIQRGLTGLVDFAKGIGHGLVMLLNHSSADTVGGAWVSNMENAKNALGSFFSFAQGVSAQIGSGFISAFNIVASSGSAMFSTLIAGITKFITSITKIPGLIGSGFSGIKDKASSVFQGEKEPILTAPDVTKYAKQEALAKAVVVDDLDRLIVDYAYPDMAAKETDPSILKSLATIEQQNLKLLDSFYDEKTDTGGLVLASKDDSEPIQVVFRYATGKALDTDLFRTEIGDEAYAGNRDQIEEILKRYSEKGKDVELSGWSLGSALAQRTAAEFPQYVKGVSAFNPVGIDQKTIAQYEKAAPQDKQHPDIKYFVNANDAATATGEGYLPGDVYNFKKKQGLGEYFNELKTSIPGDFHSDYMLAQANPLGKSAAPTVNEAPEQDYSISKMAASDISSPFYTTNLIESRFWIEPLRKNLMPFIENELPKKIAAVSTFITGVVTGIITLPTQLTNAWGNSIATIQNAWMGFGNKFQSIMGGVVSFGSGIGQALVMLLNHSAADTVGDAWVSNMDNAKGALGSFLSFAWQGAKFLLTGQIFGLIANFSAGVTSTIIHGLIDTYSVVKRELQLIGAAFDNSLDKEGRDAARRQAFWEPIKGVLDGIGWAASGIGQAIGNVTNVIHQLTDQVAKNIDFFSALALLGSVLAQTFVALIIPGTELAAIFAGMPNAIARILPLATAATIASGKFTELEDIVLGIPIGLESLTVGISEFLGLEPPLALLSFFDQLDIYAQNVKATLADFNQNILHPLIDGLLNFVLIGTVLKPTGLLFLQTPPLFQGIIDALNSPQFKAIGKFLGELFAPFAPALKGVISLFIYLQAAVISIPLHILAEASLRIQQAAKAAADFAGAAIPEFTVPDIDLGPLEKARVAVQGIGEAIKATVTQTASVAAQKTLEKLGQILSGWILKLPFGEQILTAVTIGFNYFKAKIVPAIQFIGSVVGAAMYKWGEVMVKTFPVNSFRDVLMLLPRMALAAGKGLLQASLYIVKSFFKFLPFLNPVKVIKSYFKYEKDLVPLLTPFDAFAAQANKILTSAFIGDISKQAEKFTGPLALKFQGVINRIDSVNVKVKKLVEFLAPALERLKIKIGLADFAESAGVGAALKGPIPTFIKSLSIIGLRLQYIGGLSIVWSSLYIALKSVDEGLLKAIGSITSFTLYGKRISIVSGILRTLQLIVVPTTDALVALFHNSAEATLGFSYILEKLGKRIVPTTLTNINGVTQSLYEFNFGLMRTAAPMWAVRTTQALNLVIKAFDLLLDTVGFVFNGIRTVAGMSTVGLAGLFLAEVKATLIGWKWFLGQLIVATQVVGDKVSEILAHLAVYASAAFRLDGKAILGLLNQDIGVPVAGFISWMQGLAVQGLNALAGLALTGVGLAVGAIKSLAMGAVGVLGYLFNQSVRFADALLHPVRTIRQLQGAIISLATKIAGLGASFLIVTRFIPNLLGLTRGATSGAAAVGNAGVTAEVALGGVATAATATSFAFAPLLGAVLSLTALGGFLTYEYLHGFQEIHAAIAALENPIATLSSWLKTINNLIFAPIRIPFADFIMGLTGTVIDFARKALPLALLGMAAFTILLKGPIKGIKSIASAIFGIVGAVTSLIKSLTGLGKAVAANPLGQIKIKQAALAVSSLTGLSDDKQQELAKADIKAAQASVAFRKMAEAAIQKERKRTHNLYVKASKSESATERQQYADMVETVKKARKIKLFGRFGPVIYKGEKEVTQLTEKGKVAQEKAIASNVLSQDALTKMGKESGLFDAIKSSGAGSEVSLSDLRKIATEREGGALKSLIDDFDTLFAAQKEMQQMDVKQMDVGALQILGLKGGLMGETPTKQIETKFDHNKNIDKNNFMDLQVGLSRFKDIPDITTLIKELGGAAATTSLAFKDLSTDQLKKLAKAFDIDFSPEAPAKAKSSKLYKDYGIENLERELLALNIMGSSDFTKGIDRESNRYQIYSKTTGTATHQAMAEEAFTYEELDKLIEPIKATKGAGFVDVKKLENAIEERKRTMKRYRPISAQVPESANMNVVPTEIQDELTQALALGGDAFAASKHRIIKDILEHQRSELVSGMEYLQQSVEETQVETVTDLEQVAQKFNKKTLLERIKDTISQISTKIVDNVKGGIARIGQTEVMQNRAAQQVAREQEQLAAKRREFVARAASKMGVTPGQDLELLSRLQPGKNTAQAALESMRIGKTQLGQVKYGGRTISEVTKVFQGVKPERLQDAVRKMGIEGDLQAISATLGIEYQALLEQIRAGLNGLSRSSTEAMNKFLKSLTEIDRLSATTPDVLDGISLKANNTYKQELEKLAKSFQGMESEQILKHLRTKSPTSNQLHGSKFKGTFFEYLTRAVKQQYKTDDIKEIENIILQAVKPATNVGSERRLFQLLKQGQMLELDPEKQFFNLLKKYNQDIKDVVNGGISFDDKTPLAGALRDYLTRRGELTKEGFNQLIKKMTKSTDIQDVLEQLAGVGYIKELESPKAIEDYFGFMPDLSVTQDAAFKAKQAILQGRIQGTEVMEAAKSGKLLESDVRDLFEKLASTGGFDIAQLIDPTIGDEQIKLARDLRIAKVQEILKQRGKPSNHLEIDTDTAVLAKFYSGKFHELSEDELDNLAFGLGYVTDANIAFVSKLEEDFSTISLLQPHQVNPSIFKKVFGKIGQIAKDALGITTMQQMNRYNASFNTTLTSLMGKQQRVAQQQKEQAQKERDLIQSQKEARQKALQRALLAAGMSEADLKGKLNKDLQNVFNRFIHTGKLIEVASQDVKNKVAQGFGKNFSPKSLSKMQESLANFEVVKIDKLGQKTTEKVNLAPVLADFVLKIPQNITQEQLKQYKQISEVLKQYGLDIEKQYQGKDFIDKFKKFRMDLHPSSVNDWLQTLLKTGKFERKLDDSLPDVAEMARALQINVEQFKGIGEGKFELSRTKELELQITEFLTNLHKGFTDFRDKFRTRIESITFLGIGPHLFVPLFKQVDNLVASFKTVATALRAKFTDLPIIRQIGAAKTKQKADKAKSFQTLIDRPEFGGRVENFGEAYGERVKFLLAQSKTTLPENLIDNALRAVLSPDPKGLKAGLFAATQGMENREALTKAVTTALGDTLKLTGEEVKKILEPGALSTKGVQPFIVYFAREIPDLMTQLGKLGIKASKAIFNDLVKAVGAPVNTFLGKATNRAAQTAARMVNSLRVFFPSQDKGIGKYVTKLENLLLSTGRGVQGYFDARAADIAKQKSIIGRAIKGIFSSFGLIAIAFTGITGLIKKASDKLMPMVRSLDWLDMLTLGWKGFLGRVGGGIGKVMGWLNRKMQSAVMLPSEAYKHEPGYLKDPSEPQEPKPPSGMGKAMGWLNRKVQSAVMLPNEAYQHEPGYLKDSTPLPPDTLSAPPPAPVSTPPITPPTVGGLSDPSVLGSLITPMPGVFIAPSPGAGLPVRPALPPAAPDTMFVAPPPDAGLPTAPPIPPVPPRSLPEKTFGFLSDAMQNIADFINVPAVKEIKTRRMVKTSAATRALPPAQDPNAPPLPSPYSLGDIWVPTERMTKTAWSRINAWLSENAKATATRLSMYFGETPQRVSDAWHRAKTDIADTSWWNLIKQAKIAGTFIWQALNHGAADRTAAAWSNTQHHVHGNMQGMTHDAQVAGTTIATTMQRSASRSQLFFSHLGGAIRGVGKTGFAAFGAMSAVGFAAQSAMGSLVTMGLMSEESSQKFSKFLEIFVLISTIGSVVAPTLGLVGSLFGTLGSVAGLAFNPITLSIAAVVGGLFLLNMALKRFLGIDLIEPVQQKIQKPFQGAIAFIKGAWASFVDKFGYQLMPIVQPVVDVIGSAIAKIKQAWIGFSDWFKTLPLVKTATTIAQGLINALNHSPTVQIPIAWDEATEKITNFLQTLLKVGLTVGAALVGAFSVNRLKSIGSLAPRLSSDPAAVTRRETGRRKFEKVSNKVEKFALYANAANDIAELSGIDLPDFVGPLLKITTMVGVLGDLGSEVLPKIITGARGIGLSLGAVGGIAAGIGIAVAGLYLVWSNNLFGIQEKTGYAVAQIQAAWMGFSEWFKTLPLVESAIKIAERLIGALNCNPTVQIPLAWQEAVSKITGFLGGLPIIGEFIGSKLTEIFNPAGIFGGLINWAADLLNNPAFGKISGLLGKSFGGLKEFLQSLLGTNKKVEQATTAVGENYADTFLTAQKLAMTSGDQMAAQYLKDVGAITDTTLSAPQIEALQAGSLKLDIAPGTLQNPLEATDIDPSSLPGLQAAYDAQEKRNNALQNLSAPTLEAGAAGDAGKYVAQALALQKARERSDRAMAAAMLGFQAITGKGSWEDAANYGKMANADFMETSLGKNIAAAKDKAVQMAEEFSVGFNDRMDYLAHTNGALAGALFAPGLEAAKMGGQALVGDFAHFAKVAGTALLHLDFAGVGQAAITFGSNAGAAFSSIIGGFQSASLSAIAFGVFSLLSLSPVTLTLGAIALGGLAIATNFLGLRTIFIGLGKVALGMAKIVFAVGKGFFQLGRAVRQIFTGIFTLDFTPIKQGAQTAWNAITTGAGELKDALRLIFGGIWDVVRGVFQGIGQILVAPFRGVRGAIAGIRTAFATVGSAVSQILAGVRGAITRVRNSFSTTSSAISQAITNPRQVWESFLNLLERIRQKVTGVMDAISSSAVGRAARAVTGQSKGKGKESITTPPIPAAPEVAAIEPAPTKQGWGARLFGKKGVESVPVVAPVPEVAAIEPAPAKQGWGARLFGKKVAEPVVQPVPEIPTPKPIAAVEAVKSSAVGRSVRAMGKMQAGQVVSLDEGRSAVDFEERLKGKEPGLSLSDRATVAKKGITDRLLGPKKPVVPTEDLPEEINTGARSINAANTALSSLAGTLSGFAPAAAAPLFAVSGLVDSFFSVSDALPDVKSGLVQLFPQMKGLSGVAKAAIAPVGKTLQGAITPIGTILQSAIAPIGPMIMTAIAPLAPFILPILAGIAAGAFLVHQAFKNNFLGISTFVTNLFNGVKQFFGLLFGGAWDALASVFITLETQIKNIWNAFASVGQSLMEPFQPLMRLFGINGSGGGFFGAAMKGVVNAILLPLRVVTGTINIVLKVLGHVITNVVKLGGFILGVWLAPLRLICTTVGLIWSGITGLVGGIISVGGAIISFLLAPFRATLNLLSKIPLIGGLIGDGMQPTAPGADTPANIPAYASGGFVPKTGLALLHEGEFVANPAVTGRNLEVLQRMHAGEDAPTANVEVLPAIPAPVPVAPSTTTVAPATRGGGGGGTTVQIHIENITVVSQGESSEELARDLFEELKPYLVQFFGEEGSNNPHLVRFYRGAGKNALNHLR